MSLPGHFYRHSAGRRPSYAPGNRWGKCKLFVVFIFLTGFQVAQTQNVAYRLRSTVTSCLNVRVDHSTEARTIACITRGTPITVVGSVPFWHEISFGNDQRGWVAKKFIEPVEPPANVDRPAIPPDAFLTIHFVDVGQGDAIWIQTHDDGIDGNGIFEGYSIIIDGGPYSADASNPLLPYMESQGHHGADVEALIISHPHIDHFSGAETISRHFSVRHYYDPGYPSTIASYTKFLKAMRGAPGIAGRAKMVHLGKAEFGTLNWGEEIEADILYSWDGDPGNVLGTGNTEINNASIVLRIGYGAHTFLFMGDAEGKDRDDDPQTARFVEKILLDTQQDRLKATVLKVGHHGSETSSSIPFIEAVDPEIVIVQSGRKSFSGTFLPDKTTLDRYCAHNPQVQIYRTDEGDEAEGHNAPSAVDQDHIVLRSNGTAPLSVKALQGGRPFIFRPCAN